LWGKERSRAPGRGAGVRQAAGRLDAVVPSALLTLQVRLEEVAQPHPPAV
jgi:hypothetical protein